VGHDQVYAWRRGYRPGHHDQTPVTRNERRGEQPPEHHDEVPCELNPGAGNNWAKARIHKSWARFLLNPPCSSAAFVVNSEPRTGARPSARLCVGLIALAAIYLQRFRVVCRSFAAALTHASNVATPPAPAAQNLGAGLRRPCRGADVQQEKNNSADLQRSRVHFYAFIRTVASCSSRRCTFD
jgi:hypothetical protein